MRSLVQFVNLGSVAHFEMPGFEVTNGPGQFLFEIEAQDFHGRGGQVTPFRAADDI